MAAARRTSVRGALLASGQTVRHLTLDQGIEGSNPSSPAKTLNLVRKATPAGPYHPRVTRPRLAELIFVGTLVIVGAVLVLQLALVLTADPPRVLQTQSCTNPPCVMKP